MAVVHAVDPNIGPKENFMKMLYTAYPKLTMNYEELVERVEMYYLDPNKTGNDETVANVIGNGYSTSNAGSFFSKVFKYDSTTKTYSCRILLKGRPSKGVYGSKIINITNIIQPFTELLNTVVRPIYSGTNTNPIKKVFKVDIPNVVLTGPTTEARNAYKEWLSTPDGRMHIKEVMTWLCNYASIPVWMHQSINPHMSASDPEWFYLNALATVIHENKFIWKGKTHAIIRTYPNYNISTINTPDDAWGANPFNSNGVTFFYYPNNLQNLSYGQVPDIGELFFLLEGTE